MSYRVEKVNMKTRGEPGLVGCLVDFVKRADPHGWDGFGAADLAIIIGRTAQHEGGDASWIVFDGNENVVGFAIVCFGSSIEQGRIEAQVVALYLKPGTPLHVAPLVVRTVQEYARSQKAKRLLAATQRDVCNAFQRLGAMPVGIMYELPLEEEDQPRQSSHQYY